MIIAGAVEDLLVRGNIRKADVQRLSMALAGGERIDRAVLELLFSVHETCPIQDPAWCRFFIQTVATHIVEREAPSGYLTMEQANWLMNVVRRDGAIETRTEIELVVRVLEISRWSPVSLSRFALKQVERAVAEGTGPLRGGRPFEPGTISGDEIELVGRILIAYGGDRALPITREEADVLIDIALALDRDAAANANWQAFFDRAVTNAILAASGYKAPPRGEALGITDAAQTGDALTPAGLAGRVMGLALAEVLRGYRTLTAEERALERLELQRYAIITAEPVTEVEAHWLARRLTGGGGLRSGEAALLRCLDAMAVHLHPDLQPLLAEAAAAAA